jgi:hypothetical protein
MDVLSGANDNGAISTGRERGGSGVATKLPDKPRRGPETPVNGVPRHHSARSEGFEPPTF